MARPGLLTQLLWLILPVAMVAPWLYVVYWPAGDGLDAAGHQIGRDFINVWVGPQSRLRRQARRSVRPEGYHAAIGELFGHPLPFHNWGYPLFTLPAFWPLAQLPYFVALGVWTFGLFAIFAAVTLSQVERAARGYALLALALAPACLINTIGGQNGFLTAALLIGGILPIDRRPILAGVLFGFLTFKPHLGFVLPFALLTLGAWRVIAAAVADHARTRGDVGCAVRDRAVAAVPRSGGRLSGCSCSRGFAASSPSMMVSGVAGARAFGLQLSGRRGGPGRRSRCRYVAATCWAVRSTSDPHRRAFVLVTAAHPGDALCVQLRPDGARRRSGVASVRSAARGNAASGHPFCCSLADRADPDDVSERPWNRHCAFDRGRGVRPQRRRGGAGPRGLDWPARAHPAAA